MSKRETINMMKDRINALCNENYQLRQIAKQIEINYNESRDAYKKLLEHCEELETELESAKVWADLGHDYEQRIESAMKALADYYEE